MYESFYGLKVKPFSMLPDPGFLYLSKKHQMALTLLEYSLLNQTGFCVVSGETGSGKTTLLRKLLENIDDSFTVGMITNTHKGFGELLDWVLSAYGIHEQGMSQVDMHQRFMEFIVEQYAANKSTLLIIDEAQNMTIEKLEELRMLSNVNSDKDQVLQIILAGQPDLKDTLRLPELKQFAQRIGVDHHLDSLSGEETYGYIQHRLSVAGASREIFTEEACDHIREYSGGIPRLINLLCDTVMVYGFADQQEVIDEYLVDEMVQDRMQDSIVPLATRTPSQKKKTKKKTKKKKPAPNKIEPVKDTPVEEDKARARAEIETKAVEAKSALEGISAKAEVKIEDVGDTSTTEAVAENKGIYAGVVESVAFGGSVEETIAKEEQNEDGDVSRRSPNTIEVLQPEEPPETKSWKWIMAAVVAIVASVLIFMIGTSDPDESASEKAFSSDTRTSQPAPVIQQVPEEIKRQLEEAEKFRKELALRQKEDRARMEALELQAAILQRERDQALAKAQAEKTKRTKQAAIAKAAARNAKEAQAIAKKAVAEALAAERKNQLLVKLRAEEAARLEQELLEQQSMRETEKAAKVESVPKPVVETKRKKQSFNIDPCASSTARFLSTCR